MDIQLDQPITISAERWERPYSESTSSVSLYTEEDFENSGTQTVADFLKTQAVANIYTSGAYGKASTLSLRGTSNRHTLVIVDGVRTTDLTAIGGGSRLEFLSLENLESIEILRGSQGVIYGAEAIGGVVKITTKKNSKKSAQVSYGSFKDKRMALNLGHHQQENHFQFNGTFQDVEGISARAERAGGTAPDGLKNINLRPSFTHSNPSREFSINAFYQRSEFGFDDFSAEANNEGIYESYWFNARYVEKSKELLNPEIHLDYRKVEREVIQRGSFPSTFLYDGNQLRAEITNPVTLKRGDLNFEVLPGLTFEREESKNLGTSLGEGKERERKAFFLNTRLSYQEVFFELGGREEDYSIGGDKGLYRIALGYKPFKGLTLKASQATGFRVASLYQSFSQYGNINLEPESSLSREVGLYAQYENTFLDLSLFDLEYDNFIDYDSGNNRYENIGALENKGVEIALEKRFKRGSIKASYNYLVSRNPVTRELAPRRAKKRANLVVNFSPLEKLSLTASAQYVGERLETDKSRMPSYTLVNLAGSYRWDRTTVSLALNNLFNRDYEEQRFLETPNFNYLLTLKQDF